MIRALLLVPALRTIFSSELEFTADSFAELTAAQYESYERNVGKPEERVYCVLQMEPTVIERQGRTRISLELSVVSESEKERLLEARLRFPQVIVEGE